MKAIIIASSIFYLLGLKFSNNVDLVKKANATPVMDKIENVEPQTAVGLKHPEKCKEIISGPDSLKITGAVQEKKTKNTEDI